MTVTTYHNISAQSSGPPKEVPLDVLSMDGFNSVSIQVTLIANSTSSLDIQVRESGVLGNPVWVATVSSGTTVGTTKLVLLTPNTGTGGGQVLLGGAWLSLGYALSVAGSATVQISVNRHNT